jgi:GTP cyclohydrolase II
LGVERIALLSNNPDKLRQLTMLGVEVAEHLPTATHISAANTKYLAAKLRRGHTLTGI